MLLYMSDASVEDLASIRDFHSEYATCMELLKQKKQRHFRNRYTLKSDERSVRQIRHGRKESRNIKKEKEMSLP